MGRWIVVVAAVTLLSGGWVEAAEHKSITELPKDAVDLAFVWTEPIKGVAHQTRLLDPVSGLCVGLVEGSVKSLARAFHVFAPAHSSAGSLSDPNKKPLLRYSF